MTESGLIATAALTLHFLLQCAIVIRVMLRPHREPGARMTWVVLVFSLPVAGIVAYLLFGEINIGRLRAERMQAALARLPALPNAVPPSSDASSLPGASGQYRHLFYLGETISGFAPVSGNQARLMPDSNATIDTMVADIDAAHDHVHVLFYIWLPDNNGVRIAEALMRAARRGLVCRALADDLGSRRMIRSPHWKDMAAAGVRLERALPIGNPFLRILAGRIDLRNHRKIVVIDDWITYCGSQNCADPEFRVKAKFAPWVDAVLRFEGPIARQNQYLFATDWMPTRDDGIEELLRKPLKTAAHHGLPAQVIGTGPTVRWSAMPEVFEALIFRARDELLITTPYYVPDESIQAALCASARRGIKTTIIFPARNDSRIVAAASRSYYAGLLDAGVRIFEYQKGLLHTKSLTMDGEITLIGSANMDRRSFELNYENNILFHDRKLTGVIIARQHDYLADSIEVTAEQVARWGWRRRLWNNTIAMLGPVL